MLSTNVSLFYQKPETKKRYFLHWKGVDILLYRNKGTVYAEINSHILFEFVSVNIHWV